MRRVTAIAAVVSGLVVLPAVSAGATPGVTPHGAIGACNMVIAHPGEDNTGHLAAMTIHVNEHGIDGMWHAVDRSNCT